MDAIVTIQHPAHVHLFRNAIEELQAGGHNVHVFVRHKDIAIDLLELYDIEHTVLAGHPSSFARLAVEQAKYEFRLFRHARRIDPDVMLGMSEPGVSHVSTLRGCPGLVFSDTEHATLQNALSFPLADRVCTPTCYQGSAGDKQVRYRGYHELAYLHPDRFTPEPDVVHDLGLDVDDSFTILRVNAWQAAHDVGDTGFDELREVIERLEDTGTRVIITSEPDLPPELQQYESQVALDRMHDMLYYADLVIGESATMAAESAVLGTPAVFISSSRRGYTDELGDRYGLVFTFSGSDRQDAGLEKALSILERGEDAEWAKRRQAMLADKIDTTRFILDQIRAVTGARIETSPAEASQPTERRTEQPHAGRIP